MVCMMDWAHPRFRQRPVISASIAIGSGEGSRESDVPVKYGFMTGPVVFAMGNVAQYVQRGGCR